MGPNLAAWGRKDPLHTVALLIQIAIAVQKQNKLCVEMFVCLFTMDSQIRSSFGRFINEALPLV